jgi:hypothetical protein
MNQRICRRNTVECCAARLKATETGFPNVTIILNNWNVFQKLIRDRDVYMDILIWVFH